jgi:hypothetical protein
MKNNWWRRWCLRDIDVELAELRARLQATRELSSRITEGTSTPGSIVHDLCYLPGEIAALEERRRQIEQGSL